MKAPFRQQASNIDCTPTSLINALCYLFDRKDLPPFVVHQIYKNCLDEEAARGTSDRAVQDLAFLLRNYNEKSFKNFSVNSKIIYEDQVHLRENSKIIRCINSNGIAMLTVNSSSNIWHSILAFQIRDDWLYCYDPKPRTKRFIDNEAVQFLPTIKRHDANLKIRLDWIDKDCTDETSQEERRYTLGCHEDRECLLLKRIQE